MSSKANKQKLRDKVLEERSHISEAVWQQSSHKIIETLQSTDFYKEAKVVHTYLSLNSRREVATDPLIESLFNSDKRVVVPITHFQSGTLTHTEIDSTSELEANKWGVREPRDSDNFDIAELDLIIIPLAAADRKCNRLGYGKGFYDRFLKKTKAKKVGLVFSDFLFDEIPTEEFDEKLDVIITEEEVIFA
ncbi:MAG: 5-formyltetrahydrofolate cyclo-ligase [Balneola sp.]|jgi:5-formyltetrahydrofolate cyclo-ligase|nr:5-formyltetrahydrofolate cyclo-ligase [Balneola sp.]MBE79659.1 5-formyltetrahydrofolate cyclo-ligase [Balneola sp.]|tara:strand:- start:2122 stop:2694 length:573 start_codon:yes stop_codon:yes gene_type:complete